MKKYLLILFSFFLITNSGCRSTEDKVNIIKGAGSANNSLVLSFSELCPGFAEGFGPTVNTLIISNRSTEKLELYTYDTISKKKDLLTSSIGIERHSPQVSPNGKLIIVNNQLIDTESKNTTYLPPMNYSIGAANTDSRFQPYSFIGDEAILTDPYYYLSKYFKSALKNFQLGQAISPFIFHAGDTSMGLKPENYRGIKSPDINRILDYKLLLQDLKFVFTGLRNKTGETLLFSFNFREKNFTQIDSGVKSFSVSHDGKSIAYIKRDTGRDSEDIVISSSINGSSKKELAKTNEIKEISWSSDNQWLAYSGGNAINDVYVVKADGTTHEQLTHNINASGKILWKGNKLVFTSVPADDTYSPKVFMITMNMDNNAQNISLEVASENQQLYSQLFGFLRSETLAYINKKKLE